MAPCAVTIYRTLCGEILQDFAFRNFPSSLATTNSRAIIRSFMTVARKQQRMHSQRQQNFRRLDRALATIYVHEYLGLQRKAVAYNAKLLEFSGAIGREGKFLRLSHYHGTSGLAQTRKESVDTTIVLILNPCTATPNMFKFPTARRSHRLSESPTQMTIRSRKSGNLGTWLSILGWLGPTTLCLFRQTVRP